MMAARALTGASRLEDSASGKEGVDAGDRAQQQPTMAVPWHSLPDLVLVKIFGYVGPRERLLAGLMCRGWLEALTAPQLWRSVRVLFNAGPAGQRGQGPWGGPRHPRGLGPGGPPGWDEGWATAAVLTSPRYAPLVRHLQLVWARPSPDAVPDAAHPAAQLAPALHLLEALRAAGQVGRLQLRRLHLHNLVMSYKGCSSPTQRGQLLAALAAFLGSQRQLEVLSLENACLGVSEALRLLGAAARCSGHALTALRLHAAFREWQAPHSSPRFCRALRRLAPLSSLHLDYPALSDATLQLLAECCGPALRLLSVAVRNTDNRHHAISQDAWARLAASCPHLRAVFNIENLGHYEDICGLLLPGVPLHGFRMYSGRVWDQSRSRAFRSTLRLLATQYHRTLEVLQLNLKNNREELDDLVLDLLSRCRRLTHFQFDGVLRRMSTVAGICGMRLENVIDFGSIAVRPKAANRTVAAAAKDITAAFQARLEAKAVAFQIDVPKR